MTALPKNCTQADFVVAGPWISENKRHDYKIRRIRLVRRVFSNGCSILELQEDWSDSGSCAEQFKRVENQLVALDLALRWLATLDKETKGE